MKFDLLGTKLIFHFRFFKAVLAQTRSISWNVIGQQRKDQVRADTVLADAEV